MAVVTHAPVPPTGLTARRLWAPFVAYALILIGFWFAVRHFAMEVRIGGHLPSSFVAFGLLLAPYWFFGFGLAPALSAFLSNRLARVLAPGALVVPYLIFSIPRGELRVYYAGILFAIPVGLAALFEFAPPNTPKLCWQDIVALVVIGVPVEFHLLTGSFPHPGLSALPKFLLMDAGLYAFLVVRRLQGVGYDLRPRLRDVVIGLREWSVFALIAIPLGMLLGFIAFRPWLPPLSSAASAVLITFFFVALPEEFFFRGLLQNMLEARLGGRKALILASIIFGLSHFNKPLPFNWRYVILASIAGIFYGRAWRDRRRLLSSATTHTAVDVVWSLWFR